MEKNEVKKPEYAICLGKGKFAGVLIKWQCSKCGKVVTSAQKPMPQPFGRCPQTASGNHMWKKY